MTGSGDDDGPRTDTGARPDPYRDWDASYVLGMLSPEERREFERHLVDCPACTAAVGELAGLPGILGGLSASEATALLEDDARSAADAHLGQLSDGTPLVRELAHTVRRRRTRTRRRLAAVIAGAGAVLAGAGVLVGVALGAGVTPSATVPSSAVASAAPPEANVASAMSQVEPGRLEADLIVTEKGWGTRFDWNCSYRDDGPYSDGPTTYDLVVTDADGTQTTVATWTAAGSSAGNLSASTSIPTSTIREVDIRVAGTDQPLVRTKL
ncbi:anti-sigma factor family protein [Herbiconiux sp. YIM B11900]|uniref:anti-sigma factor family protein n=1 Tax=Herbiconiux sp. YIM B11900 TaxID=3404131 RepID=UPI003F8489F4